AEFKDVYLNFQEYFEKLGKDPKRWGKPLSALLGAFDAQMDLGIGAIGGKDSMSGSFEDIHVPPTLISFAVTTGKVDDVISPEFKTAGRRVFWLRPQAGPNDLPNPSSLKKVFEAVAKGVRDGKIVAAYTPGMGGPAEAVMKMAFGNGIGFRFAESVPLAKLFAPCYGSFLVEATEDLFPEAFLGTTTADGALSYGTDSVSLKALADVYEGVLEDVFPCNIRQDIPAAEPLFYHGPMTAKAPLVKKARPKVLIPAFPGTNCEYDTAKAMADAGADARIIVVRNLTADAITASVDEFARELKDAEMVFIPGGFSGGDEPDGSGKFITAFFRNAAIKDGVTDLLDRRGGLMAGICNGFQALIKLGLVPYGKIIDTDETCPTLSFNVIARHQSKIVRTVVSSAKSPWLAACNVGDIYSVPISHGEGRFICSDALVKELAANGQIVTQYVDLAGNVSTDVQFNPNGSTAAIEGISSPDGRVFGKMGHTERYGYGLYKNVPGNYEMGLFESAVKFFK
ncbi:MAG: phosphoribosylformylglycinamidine synthase subunit PurQ, partial [Firmicutes bacterium]|nr:phosphoribosylformylglycinamidine synthase subunit PurQ [Bacillota bacterium]